MRIVEVTYHKHANLLVEALQKYCRILVSEPQRNGISSLKDIEDSIWKYAEKIRPNFPNCNLEKLEVVSHTNILHEWYNLLYKGEKSMISIFARPDGSEMAFREYDQMKSYNRPIKGTDLRAMV
jgi:hypothetical protein